MASKKSAVEEELSPPPEANIKFVGKAREEYGKTIEALPLIRVNHGTQVIRLPDAEAQREGFFHEAASVIVRLFPDLYKLVKPLSGGAD